MRLAIIGMGIMGCNYARMIVDGKVHGEEPGMEKAEVFC